MENQIVARVIERMELLPLDLQQLVLEFIQTLQASTQQGVTGQQMLSFAGIIPGEELAHMRQAVATDLPRLNSALTRDKVAPVDPTAKPAPVPVTPPR